MKSMLTLGAVSALLFTTGLAPAEPVTLNSVAPVVVQTEPVAGSDDIESDNHGNSRDVQQGNA